MPSSSVIPHSSDRYQHVSLSKHVEGRMGDIVQGNFIINHNFAIYNLRKAAVEIGSDNGVSL